MEVPRFRRTASARQARTVWHGESITVTLPFTTHRSAAVAVPARLASSRVTAIFIGLLCIDVDLSGSFGVREA